MEVLFFKLIVLISKALLRVKVFSHLIIEGRCLRGQNPLGVEKFTLSIFFIQDGVQDGRRAIRAHSKMTLTHLKMHLE